MLLHTYNPPLNLITKRSAEISPGLIDLRSTTQSAPDIVNGTLPFTPTTEACAPADGLKPRIVIAFLNAGINAYRSFPFCVKNASMYASSFRGIVRWIGLYPAMYASPFFTGFFPAL